MFHPMITVQLPFGALDVYELVQNKTLMAGLNIYEQDDTWLVTTSAWGLMELANHLGNKGYYSKIDALCDSYNKYHNKNTDIMGFLPADTPQHHQWFTFRFDTELATKAQLYTHTVGLAKSSQSFRYVGDKEDDIRFYIPLEWRGKAENVKQGSSDEVVEEHYIAQETEHLHYARLLHHIRSWHEVNPHIANEQRRYILPQAQMSIYVVTGTREAWERVIRLRCDPHAQKEIRLLFEQVADLIASDKEWM
jgi:thymidylate synthase (FAD)